MEYSGCILGPLVRQKSSAQLPVIQENSSNKPVRRHIEFEKMDSSEIVELVRDLDHHRLVV
jgi:hypothetical protein